MKKSILLIMAVVFLATILYSCTEAQLKGGGLGAGVGGLAGALIDKKNPYRGGLIGAAAGAVLGSVIADMSERAVKEAALQNRPVRYDDRRGHVVQATPVGYNPQTRCKKISNKAWEDGQLIADNVQEVCN